MNTMLAKEKPDLLFNNPLKQKVYVFLKNNPGKDFETFQVLTGDSAVSRQHFNEVEQAIRAREERDRSRAVARDVHALFLQGAIGDRPRIGGSSDSPEEKERILKKIEKKKLNEKAKQYIKEHPACSYDELVKALDFQELTKPHFFSMKTQLRKKGLISEESRTRRGRKPGEKRQPAPARESRPAASHSPSASTTKTVEILETIAAGGFSDEIREHYKSHVLPLLRKLVPGGETLQLVFITDPPTMELRRGVS